MSRMVTDDEMWSRLEKLLPKPKGRHGKDDRLFMEALCWMLRSMTKQLECTSLE